MGNQSKLLNLGRWWRKLNNAICDENKSTAAASEWRSISCHYHASVRHAKICSCKIDVQACYIPELVPCFSKLKKQADAPQGWRIEALSAGRCQHWWTSAGNALLLIGVLHQSQEWSIKVRCCDCVAKLPVSDVQFNDVTSPSPSRWTSIDEQRMLFSFAIVWSLFDLNTDNLCFWRGFWTKMPEERFDWSEVSASFCANITT